MTNSVKRVLIYTRVSRDDTGEGRSVARQLDACRKLADLRGWEIVGEKDETGSAWSGKERPVWMEVMEKVQAGECDIVLAWAIDRMTRSMTDLEQLILLAEDKGVGIATVSGDIDLTSDVGRMVARILAAVARQEVERKAARQRLANQQRANEGRPFTGGLRPFGYAQDGMTIMEDEAALIRQGAKDVLAGVPLRQVANAWTQSGHLSPQALVRKGAKWSPTGVKDLLTNPRNAGILTYKGEEIRVGVWEPILDLETFKALQDFLGAPSRRGGNANGKAPQNLLTGIALCGMCADTTVRGSSIRGKLTYGCSPRGHFDGAVREAADNAVASAVIARLLEGDVQQLVMIAEAEDVEAARLEAAEAREAQATLGREFAAGRVEMATMLAATPLLKARLDAAETVLARAGARTGIGDLLGLSRRDLTAAWKAMDLHRQRTLVNAFLTVEIWPSGPRSKYSPPWDPDQFMTITPKEAPSLDLLTA